MTRTGKPETVSLAVDGPTRTYDQHTKPTIRAGSDWGATDRVEHMQTQKNNTEPNFTTKVYIHELNIHELKTRVKNPPRSVRNRVENVHRLSVRIQVGPFISLNEKTD